MSPAGEVVAFVEAALAEQEGHARFALDLQAREPDPESWTYRYEWVRHSRFLPSGGDGSMFLPGAPSPDQVLREVAAKRRLLLMAGAWHRDNPTGGPRDCAIGVAIAMVLADLASMYSTRPGYRSEWAPQEVG